MSSNIKRGRFIAFEGPDGSGKSTQARNLYNNLQAMGIDTIITREPGGSSIGHEVRDTLLTPRKTPLDVKAELMLVLADRVQHVKETIEPYLMEGVTVVCDRFSISSVVYQGIAGGLGVDFVHDLSRWASEGTEPDLTIFTRCSVANSIKRMQDRGIELDAMENRDFTFKQTLVNGYRMMEKKINPERRLIVPEKYDEKEAANYILSGTLNFLGKRL